MGKDDEFTMYVAGRRRQLLGTAYLLCGDWHSAEDLVQTTLTKLFLAWPRVRRRGAEDAYARKVLVRTAIDAHRRAWNRELVVDTVPDRAAPEPTDADRDSIVVALMALAPRQRATVVMRYWLDLSVDDTAAELGVSTGTVKSQAAKGLANLRTLLSDEQSRK